MHRRITRTVVLLLAPAAGVAGSSDADSAKTRVCGPLGIKVDGQPASVIIERNATTKKGCASTCARPDRATARRVCAGTWAEHAQAPSRATGRDRRLREGP